MGSYIALKPAGAVFKGLCPFHNDIATVLRRRSPRQNVPLLGVRQVWRRLSVHSGIRESRFPRGAGTARAAGRHRLTRRGTAKSLDAAPMLDAVRWAADRYHESCCSIRRLRRDGAALSRRAAVDRRDGSAVAARLRRRLAGDWLGASRPASAGADRTARRCRADCAEPSERRLITTGSATGSCSPSGTCADRWSDSAGESCPSRPCGPGAEILNSCDTPLFKKSDLIYGLDQARLAGQSAGCLAVVEGYTDVLMAHQMGVANVVATMGTALTARTSVQLRRYSPRVVLVYDADEGGTTGVDRALELFPQEDVDLAIATLPEGMDPCDLLVSSRGRTVWQSALRRRRTALDFKLDQALRRTAGGRGGRQSAGGRCRCRRARLGAGRAAGTAGRLKRELVLDAHRPPVRPAGRSRVLGAARRDCAGRRREPPRGRAAEEAATVTSARSAAADRSNANCSKCCWPTRIWSPWPATRSRRRKSSIPGFGGCWSGLYDLLDEGEVPDTRPRCGYGSLTVPSYGQCLRMQVVGRLHSDRPVGLAICKRCRRVARTSDRELQTSFRRLGITMQRRTTERSFRQRVAAPPAEMRGRSTTDGGFGIGSDSGRRLGSARPPSCRGGRPPAG